MHLVYPPKICITILFDFSWDDCNTEEKLETMVMQIWGGGKQDALWSMWKLWMNGKCKKWQQHIPFFFTCPFFYRFSRFCQATESHSRTHAPPSINSSQQGRLISKQNIILQLAAVQHKLFNSNKGGCIIFLPFPFVVTHLSITGKITYAHGIQNPKWSDFLDTDYKTVDYLLNMCGDKGILFIVTNCTFVTQGKGPHDLSNS